MRTTTRRTGITFAVDRVEPATEPLPEIRAHEGAKRIGGVESCSDYHGTVVEDVYYQPLLAAVHTAFSQHRPLVLSPDAVWITIDPPGLHEGVPSVDAEAWGGFALARDGAALAAVDPLGSFVHWRASREGKTDAAH